MSATIQITNLTFGGALIFVWASQEKEKILIRRVIKKKKVYDLQENTTRINSVNSHIQNGRWKDMFKKKRGVVVPEYP